MAFESQMSAQREQSQQRIIIKQNVFLLQIAERTRGEKGKEHVLKVRVPLDHLKKASIDVKQPMDVFYDHENHKAMLANSLGGIKFTVKGPAAEAIFVFVKGHTPDFGATIVESYELVPHGDAKGIVFEYRPRMMVEGLNTVKANEQPTRGQKFAQALVTEEDKRTAAQRTAATGVPSAPPATTQQYALKHVEPQDGIRTRRSFTDAEKKEAVRAHLRWMNTGDGMGFDRAAKEVDVAPSVMRKWRALFLKAVEREERQLGGGSRKSAKALNGTAAHARH